MFSCALPLVKDRCLFPATPPTQEDRDRDASPTAELEEPPDNAADATAEADGDEAAPPGEVEDGPPEVEVCACHPILLAESDTPHPIGPERLGCVVGRWRMRPHNIARSRSRGLWTSLNPRQKCLWWTARIWLTPRCWRVLRCVASLQFHGNRRGRRPRTLQVFARMWATEVDYMCQQRMIRGACRALSGFGESASMRSVQR